MTFMSTSTTPPVRIALSSGEFRPADFAMAQKAPLPASATSLDLKCSFTASTAKCTPPASQRCGNCASARARPRSAAHPERCTSGSRRCPRMAESIKGMRAGDVRPPAADPSLASARRPPIRVRPASCTPGDAECARNTSANFCTPASLASDQARNCSAAATASGVSAARAYAAPPSGSNASQASRCSHNPSCVTSLPPANWDK
mmetsp:Transcript_45752/g.126955  ORF Transcript_45752/g.126955 Transcript_45752/m.126955 type:complete len:204 (-) Transcript_45752:415-1026(-)